MALVNIKPFLYPVPWTSHAYTQSPASPTSNFALNEATDKLGFIFPVPQGDGTDIAASRLAKVGFRTGTIGQWPTNGLKVSFQDPSTSNGDPDGSVDQFSTITSSPGANSWAKVPSYMGAGGGGSGAKRIVTAGDLVAIVIEFASFIASDNLNVVGISTAQNRGLLGQQYISHFDATAGVWAKSITAIPLFGLEYDDGSYFDIDDVIPFSALTTQTFNNTGTDQLALMFQVPFDCKVNGFWANLEAAGSVDVILYDSSDVAFTGCTRNLNPNIRNRTGNCMYRRNFATQQLARNTDYKLAVQGKDATNNKLIYADVDTAAVLDQMQGGQGFRWATKAGAGAWSSPTTTRRPQMGVSISAVDDGTGSGGAANVRYHPGMGGGMRG